MILLNIYGFNWDQNVRARDSKTPDVSTSRIGTVATEAQFDSKYVSEGFDGGFKIQYVKAADGSELTHVINSTMMRIDLPQPLASGETFQFSIKWWYNINNYVDQGGSFWI